MNNISDVFNLLGYSTSISCLLLSQQSSRLHILESGALTTTKSSITSSNSFMNINNRYWHTMASVPSANRQRIWL